MHAAGVEMELLDESGIARNTTARYCRVTMMCVLNLDLPCLCTGTCTVVTERRERLRRRRAGMVGLAACRWLSFEPCEVDDIYKT
jgi:hypothetical protein